MQRNHARLCGVVTGGFDSTNSASGHAVKLVGMFDLPANRATPETGVIRAMVTKWSIPAACGEF